MAEQEPKLGESEKDTTLEAGEKATEPKVPRPPPTSPLAKAALPLAIAVGAGALVYTLTTPDRVVNVSPAGKPGIDCGTALKGLEQSLALYEVAAARQDFSRASGECEKQPAWQGSEAELLVLEGQVADGKKLAQQALTKQPKLLSARRVECLSLLQAAESQRARDCFAALLKEAPQDLATVFHAGRASQQANVYRGAREGYLKALRLEPKHVEARFRLVQLTHVIGAHDESENHLKKLEQIARPDDPRLAQARQLLAEGNSAPAAAAAPRASAP